MMEEDQAQEFDLEAYIANYTSHTKIDRLVFIAERSKGTPLELEALKIAADDLRQSLTENFRVGRYQDVIQRIGGRLPGYELDLAAIEAAEAAALQRQAHLEGMLNSAKTNLIKESIRMGHNDLGDHFYNRGDLQNAFKCYVRTRDYCTSPKHIVQMCLAVVRVATEMTNFVHVQNYVAKAEQTPDVLNDTVTAAKLHSALGLAHLEAKKYKMAAKQFVDVSPELANAYSDVLSPQDVALYGGLTALATFDRAELKTRVVNNIGFREYMELYPEVRDLVTAFYSNRYADALSALERLRPSLALDIHLHDHVASLVQQVRQRALTQYVSPFTSVSLAAMATAFNTNAEALEREVAGLIMDGAVQARIDSHQQVVYARHKDLRATTFAHILQVGEEYVRETKALLLRASLMQHDIVQRGTRRGGGVGGGGAGGGSARWESGGYEGRYGPSRGERGGGTFERYELNSLMQASGAQ